MEIRGWVSFTIMLRTKDDAWQKCSRMAGIGPITLGVLAQRIQFTLHACKHNLDPIIGKLKNISGRNITKFPHLTQNHHRHSYLSRDRVIVIFCLEWLHYCNIYLVQCYLQLQSLKGYNKMLPVVTLIQQIHGWILRLVSLLECTQGYIFTCSYTFIVCLSFVPPF